MCIYIYVNLYHDAWADERYRHSIYLPYTLAQPLIFPYTLGCVVARTTKHISGISACHNNTQEGR